MAARSAGSGGWEVVKRGRRPGASSGGRGGGGGSDRRALGEANGVLKYDLSSPIQTTSTLYERGFEKIMKRQNKEQVPPPAAESKKPINKKQPKKVTAVPSQNLTEGLKVWLGIMLPVLGIKALSPFAIAYLDRLLLMHPNLTKGFGMIGPKDFFPLLDFAYMPNNSLSPSLQEQLCQLFPRLKVLAFGAKPESSLHTYFPSFLSRATPSCPAAMKKELLASLTQCLTVDPLSTSVWRQLYPKHLSQSSLLLEHLLKSWEHIPKKARKSLQETIQSLKVTNQELLKKGSGGSEHVLTCDTACKGLLQRARGPRPPWARLFLLLLVFAVGFLCHDLRSNSSLQASLTGRLLRSSGLLPVGQQVCARLSSYSLQSYNWLQETLPACGSHLLAVVQPSLQLAWTHIYAIFSFLSASLLHLQETGQEHPSLLSTGL